jgi:hypothetical protein
VFSCSALGFNRILTALIIRGQLLNHPFCRICPFALRPATENRDDLYQIFNQFLLFGFFRMVYYFNLAIFKGCYYFVAVESPLPFFKERGTDRL